MQVPSPRNPEQPTTGGSSAITQMLITGNPFYLISVAFVIHGTSFWHKASDQQEPWILMAMLSVFIVMLTAVSIGIVRFGRVWDDARSIFLLLLLLVLELAISFDQTLVGDTARGVPLIIFGWAFTVVVFEVIIHSLQIKLPPLLRVPAHIMFVLLFLYPATMVASISNSWHSTIQWQLFAYPFLVAFSVLALIPAVRLGQRYTLNNNTPWSWPFYPWTLFALLLIGLCVRSYAMCVSLDPAISQSVAAARQLDSIFGLWFLTPVLLAAGLLLLESRLISARPQLNFFVMLLPVLTVEFTIGTTNHSELQRQFRSMVTDQLASPEFLAVLSAAAFYLIACWKRIPSAEWWLSAAVIGLAYATPDAQELQSLLQPHLAPFVVLSAVHLLVAWNRRHAGHAAFSIACAVPVWHAIATSHFGSGFAFAVDGHVLLTTCLMVGLIRKEQVLLAVASLILMLFCLAAVFPQATPFGSLPYSTRLLYVTCVLAVSLALMFAKRLWQFAPAAAIAGSFLLMTVGRTTWVHVRDIKGWQGLLFYIFGIFWLIIGVSISWLKAKRQLAHEHTNPVGKSR